MRECLIKFAFMALVTILTVAVFGFWCWFMWPLMSPGMLFLISVETWCVMIVLSRPLAALQMWLLRPKPIRLSMRIN